MIVGHVDPAGPVLREPRRFDDPDPARWSIGIVEHPLGRFAGNVVASEDPARDRWLARLRVAFALDRLDGRVWIIRGTWRDLPDVPHAGEAYVSSSVSVYREAHLR